MSEGLYIKARFSLQKSRYSSLHVSESIGRSGKATGKHIWCESSDLQFDLVSCMKWCARSALHTESAVDICIESWNEISCYPKIMYECTQHFWERLEYGIKYIFSVLVVGCEKLGKTVRLSDFQVFYENHSIIRCSKGFSHCSPSESLNWSWSKSHF
jgi:hypothetical protein